MRLDADGESVPGTFTYAQRRAPCGPGNNQTLSVSFTPTDTTDYASTSATTTINILQATPTITWANPANIVGGTPLRAPSSTRPAHGRSLASARALRGTSATIPRQGRCWVSAPAKPFGELHADRYD